MIVSIRFNAVGQNTATQCLAVSVTGWEKFQRAHAGVVTVGTNGKAKLEVLTT